MVQTQTQDPTQPDTDIALPPAAPTARKIRPRAESVLTESTIRFDVALRPERITKILLAIVTIMVAISTAGRLAIPGTSVETHRWLHAIVRRTSVDYEMTLPSWFSSALLLLCALLLARIAAGTKARQDKWHRYWLGLSLAFLVFSLDEAIALHETLIAPLQALGTGGLLHFAWVIPGSICVLVGAIAYRRFLFDLEPRIRRLMIWAAGLFVGGALILEMLGGALHDWYGEYSVSYILVSTVEEVAEMTGVVLFVHTLLVLLGREAAHDASETIALQGDGPNPGLRSERH